MEEPLDRALTLIEEGALDRALDPLIAAWQVTRDTALARAIEAVDAVVGAPAFVTGCPAPEAAAPNPPPTWELAAEEVRSAAERGPIIRAIFGMKTAEIVSSLHRASSWDDPRVGSVVIALLTELRYSGARSQPFWCEVFDRIPSLRDPRFEELIDTLPKTWNVGPSMQRWLTNRLKKATKERVAIAPLTEAQAESLARIVALTKAKADGDARTARSASAERGGAISADSLLADIYESPDDDAPRLVYADWLLERADPRGELISIQLRSAAEKDKGAIRRERSLLSAHRKEWLGRLAPVVGGDLVFQRGFLARATVKFRHQRDVEQYGSLPEWATLEEIEWGSQLVRDDQIEWSRWLGPAMWNVRIARGAYAKYLLIDGPRPWSIEALDMAPEDSKPGVLRQLLLSPRLPKLRAIGLRSWGASASWLEVLDDLERHPEQLTLWMSLGHEECARWREGARKTRIETLVFREWGEVYSYRFSRDASGAFRRLDVEVRPRKRAKELSAISELSALERTLKALAPRSLSHFHATVEVNGEMVEATPVMEVGLARVES